MLYKIYDHGKIKSNETKINKFIVCLERAQAKYVSQYYFQRLHIQYIVIKTLISELYKNILPIRQPLNWYEVEFVLLLQFIISTSVDVLVEVSPVLADLVHLSIVLSVHLSTVLSEKELELVVLLQNSKILLHIPIVPYLSH